MHAVCPEFLGLAVPAGPARATLPDRCLFFWTEVNLNIPPGFSSPIPHLFIRRFPPKAKYQRCCPLRNKASRCDSARATPSSSSTIQMIRKTGRDTPWTMTSDPRASVLTIAQMTPIALIITLKIAKYRSLFTVASDSYADQIFESVNKRLKNLTKCGCGNCGCRRWPKCR